MRASEQVLNRRQTAFLHRVVLHWIENQTGDINIWNAIELVFIKVSNVMGIHGSGSKAGFCRADEFHQLSARGNKNYQVCRNEQITKGETLANIGRASGHEPIPLTRSRNCGTTLSPTGGEGRVRGRLMERGVRRTDEGIQTNWIGVGNRTSHPFNGP
jgi:hypothetical protein